MAVHTYIENTVCGMLVSPSDIDQQQNKCGVVYKLSCGNVIPNTLPRQDEPYEKDSKNTRVPRLAITWGTINISSKRKTLRI